MTQPIEYKHNFLLRSTPLLLIGGVLCFFLITLAPTVLWGDQAYFQRTAFDGTLRPDAGGHWLWLQAVQLFTHLPWGDVAYRVNLLSAAAAAVTILILYCAIRALNIDRLSAVIACSSLAISHTFWMHAVRAEVYTVFTALMALQLWLWFSWRPQKFWPIAIAAGLFGVTLLGHQLAILMLPAAAILIARQRQWLDRRQRLALFGAFTIGLVPFIVIVVWQTHAVDLFSGLWRYFTHADVDFSRAMFDVSWAQLPHDTALWLGLLGLQFVGPAGLLGLRGFIDRHWSPPWIALGVLYATGVAFAFSYRVNDQFVFYLPSYLAFTFFIARGWHILTRQSRWFTASRRATVLVLIVAVPMATYALLPRALTALRLNPLDIRTLPGRDPNQYFLWPGSRDDYGAAIYARTALASLPPASVVIADHTPLEALRYVQSVEGVRPDVQLVKIEPGDDLAPVLKPFSNGQAIFLADDDPRYYNLGSIPDRCLKPFGDLHQLIENESRLC